MQFFYDAQIRRFVLQFIRYFTQFQVEYGKDSNGNMIYYTVPVRYADTNHHVSAILNNNSENTLRSIPMMVAYIDTLKYHREHIADPTFVEKRTIRERAVDPVTGELKTYQKNVVTVERHMPVPYTLGLKLDILTKSMEHKLQLLEQIVPMFNPSREIQNTDNFIDWTSVTYCTLTDLNFTSRSIPVGTEDPLDVCTISFEIHMYITAPAKVKKLNAVTSVVATVYDAQGNLAQAIEDQIIQIGKRQWFTPSGYDTIVYKDPNVDVYNVILSKVNVDTGSTNIPSLVSDPVPWRGIINYIGEITNGVSQMAFVNESNGNTVIGTISYHPTDATILLFTLDPATVPSNTLATVLNIIDPLTAGPNVNLPAAAAGQRYLIINNNIGNPDNDPANHPSAWRNADNSAFYANANDIIEYDGNQWTISFDSVNTNTVEYVTNLYSGIQLKWVNSQWQKSWEGLYKEGLWLIII
jgi:T4-like virus Myoviridae tail sheath stabiliser